MKALIIPLSLILSLLQFAYAEKIEIYDPQKGSISSGEINNGRGSVYDPQEGYQIEIEVNDDKSHKRHDQGQIYDPQEGNVTEIKE